MARFVFTAVLALVAVIGGMPGLRAQVPPLDEATDPIEDTVNQVEDTVDQVEGAVDQTVDETVGNVEQTAEGAGAAIGDAGGELTGGGGPEGGSATGSLSGAVGAAGTAGGSSGGGERGERGGGGRERSPARRLGANRGASQMARVLSEAERAPLMPAAYVPLMVELTNDADGDGSYAEAESAPRPHADIPFQLRLENAGPHELVILAIRDASPSPLGLSDQPACGDMAGKRLAPDQSTVCRFTVEGLAPAEGERLVAVLEVDAAETADPSITGTVTDTSVIRTGAVGVLGDFVRRVLTLATTGAWIAVLMAVAVGLAAAGVWMVRVGNRRRETSRAWIRSRTAAPVATARTGRDPRSLRRGGQSRHTIGSSMAGHVTVRPEELPAGTTRR